MITGMGLMHLQSSSLTGVNISFFFFSEATASVRDFFSILGFLHKKPIFHDLNNCGEYLFYFQSFWFFSLQKTIDSLDKHFSREK